MSEIRDDIMNFAGVDYSDNQDVSQDSDQTYTREDEIRERKRAEEALKSEKIGLNNIQSNGGNQDFNKDMGQIKNMIMQFKNENDTLKKELSELKSGYTSIKGEVDNHALDKILRQIGEEEKEIGSDETISSYYNKEEVLKNLQKNANVGKVLTPFEQMAILKFKDVAKENAELKQQMGNRKKILGTPIGRINSADASLDDDLADVHGLPYEEAQQKIRNWQRKQLDKIGV